MQTSQAEDERNGYTSRMFCDIFLYMTSFKSLNFEKRVSIKWKLCLYRVLHYCKDIFVMIQAAANVVLSLGIK